MKKLYNYESKISKDFYHNANVIAQYVDINDNEYFNYYHNTALIYVVQIDKDGIKDFADYIKNNPTKMLYSDAIKYIQNKEKQNEQRNNISSDK